ncbi:MAG: carboxypeptidase-like regulatory domain-containing protein, partial [Bacteroidales bacterium]|nr:carboxypeptidase-like regulatory domain-containing protein [Bacteroidales bacterium]
MSANNGIIFKYISAIALLISLIPSQKILCQDGILDSSFTFRAGTIKTVNALNLITRHTGYHFTYDSRLVDPAARSEMNFRQTKLREILNSILGKDSLLYSVIDQFIIISRNLPPPSPPSYRDTTGMSGIRIISGIVLDGESSEPLPFATIALKQNGRGTVSNNNGEFGLKLLPGDRADTIVVSYLGYFAREIPVIQSLGSNFVVEMKREFISIPEIIIKNQIPQEIIYKTLSGIPRNYGNTPAGMTAFYREGVLRRSQLQTYSEAILQIFKSPYTATLLNDQIKVLKSRKIENINVSDSVTVRLKAGLSTCLELDGIRNSFDFLSRGAGIEDYSYRLTDIVSYDDESVFEIEFG